MRGLFGVATLFPAPRRDTHFMAQITKRYKIPITILSDGTGLCAISPLNVGRLANAPATTLCYPFIAVAVGSTTFPFAATPTMYDGPLSTLFTQKSVMSFGIDAIRLYYNHA